MRLVSAMTYCDFDGSTISPLTTSQRVTTPVNGATSGIRLAEGAWRDGDNPSKCRR